MKGKLDIIKRENAERLSLAENLDSSLPDSEHRIDGSRIASQSTGIVPQTRASGGIDVPVTGGSVGPACFEAYKIKTEFLLIINGVKKDMNSFEEVKIQEMPLALSDSPGNTTPAVIKEPDLTEDQTPAKVCSIAKITGFRSKRKRGSKKGSTGGRRGRSMG